MSEQLRDVVYNPGLDARIVVLKENLLSDLQKELLRFERCYRGKQFDEITRVYAWGTRLIGKNKITRDQWKPRFIPPLAKELVKTHSAYLMGNDKFPSINVKSSQALYSQLDIPEGYEGDTETGQAKAQADTLQTFARSVLEQAKAQLRVTSAVEKALVKRQQPVLIQVYAGKVRYALPDRTWCNWGRSDENPDEIDWFQESYLFRRAGDESKDEYLYQRRVDTERWQELEYPIIVDSEGKHKLGEPVVLLDEAHGLDFCPVVIFPDDESIAVSLFEDGMDENIKGHIEMYNDVRWGVFSNADPQWVLIKDAGDEAQRAGRPGQKDDEPLKKGDLWELIGSSIQSFANQTEGYVLAGETLEKEEALIRRASNTIDIPLDNDQSGRALEYRLMPQFAAIDRYRVGIDESLTLLVWKSLLAAVAYADSLVLPEGVQAPRSLDGVTIELDWGEMETVTPALVMEYLSNIREMLDMKLLSHRSAQNQSLPLVRIEDIEAERRQIQIEEDERRQDEISLADAAFDAMKDKRMGFKGD